MPASCYRMPFGKHRGTVVSELPSSYIKWLLENTELREPLATEIELEWERRYPATNGNYAVAKINRTLALELVNTGYRRLSSKYHPDLGGDVATMQQLNAIISEFRKALE